MKFLKNVKYSLILLVLLQPFLDVYFLYVPPVTDWFPFSPATIIRIILILVIVILYILSKYNFRRDLFAAIYSIILILYLVVHLEVTSSFKSTNPLDFGYSVTGEIFYWIRMILPLIVIYITYRTDISEHEFDQVIRFLAWVISGSIVISNLFTFSLTSYSGGWIQGNIFNWFYNPQGFSYFGLASKGFFYFANAISAVEVLLTPILLYYATQKTSASNIALIFTQLLAMLMLGTKVASLGFFIVLIGYMVIYFFYSFILKEFKFRPQSLLILFSLLVIGGAILPKSPMLNRSSSDAAVQKTRDGTKEEKKKKRKQLEEEKKKSEEAEKKENKLDKRKETPLMKFIKNNYVDYSLNPRFVLDGYSYKDDPQFWYQIMKWPIADRLNNRKVEESILNRAKSRNNNKLNDWFGISYTRMNNIAILEQDFISQWYSMGYIGILLLLVPYILVFFFCLFKVITFWKKQYSFLEINILFGVGFILVLSVFSGNVLDFLTDTIILGFILGYLLNQIVQKKRRLPINSKR